MVNIKNYKGPILWIKSRDYFRVIDEIVDTSIDKGTLFQKKLKFISAQGQLKTKVIDGNNTNMSEIINDIQENSDIVYVIYGEAIPIMPDYIVQLQNRLSMTENSIRLIFISPAKLPKDFHEHIEVITSIYKEPFLTNHEIRVAEKLGISYDEMRNRKLEEDNILQRIKPSKYEYISTNGYPDMIRLAIKSNIGTGTLMVGLPGTGKSLLASELAKDHKVWKLNIAAVYNKYVGETEERFNQAIKNIDRLGKIIVFIDEFDKMFSDSSEQFSGNGVGRRLLGSFLQWLEKEKDAYIIASANNIIHLPGELLRPGRWDMIVPFLPPDMDTKNKIRKYYDKVYDVKIPTDLLMDNNIVPADIANAGKLLKMFGFLNTWKPTYKTMDNWNEIKRTIKKYTNE